MGLLRRFAVRRARKVNAERAAAFAPHLEEGEELLQTTAAKDEWQTNFILGVTDRQVLWYPVREWGNVERMSFETMHEAGWNSKSLKLGIGRIEFPLVSEVVAGLRSDVEYERYLWDLYPSPFSLEVLAAIQFGLERLGRLEEVQHNFMKAAGWE